MEEVEYYIEDEETALATVGEEIEVAGTVNAWVNPETMEINVAAIQSVFDSIRNVNEAKEVIDGMDRFRKWLEALRLMEKNLDMFCYVEAKMWVDLSRRFKTTVPFDRASKNMLNWLKGKTNNEVADILRMCSEGKRIKDVKREDCAGERMKKAEAKKKSVLDEHLRISHEIANEFIKTGHTVNNAGRYVEMWDQEVSEGPNTEVVRGLVKKTQDRILAEGGVGLGNGSGVYVSSNRLTKEEAIEVVRTRANSILADIRKLSDICHDHGVRISPSGIKKLKEAVDAIG